MSDAKEHVGKESSLQTVPSFLLACGNVFLSSISPQAVKSVQHADVQRWANSKQNHLTSIFRRCCGIPKRYCYISSFHTSIDPAIYNRLGLYFTKDVANYCMPDELSGKRSA